MKMTPWKKKRSALKQNALYKLQLSFPAEAPKYISTKRETIRKRFKSPS